MPTVREADDSALSSCERFLSPEERAKALLLHAALRRAAARIVAGEAADAALVEADTLRPLDMPSSAEPARRIAAARLGTLRLLGNIPLDCARDASSFRAICLTHRLVLRHHAGAGEFVPAERTARTPKEQPPRKLSGPRTAPKLELWKVEPQLPPTV